MGIAENTVYALLVTRLSEGAAKPMTESRRRSRPNAVEGRSAPEEGAGAVWTDAKKGPSSRAALES